MNLLAIETSCDETAAAVITTTGEPLYAPDTSQSRFAAVAMLRRNSNARIE